MTPTKDAGDDVSLGANEDVVLRYLDATFNRHDLSGLDQFTSSETVKQVITGFITAFPDTAMTVKQVVADGDVVVVRSETTAAHLGPWRGRAPTGRAWKATASGWFTVQDGKITGLVTN